VNLWAGILEIANQFLLLGVDRDGRFTACQCRFHLLVDVAELRIAIGVTAALAGLAIGLQAIAKRTQQLSHHTVADPVTKLAQTGSQIAQALRRPQQRGLRIAAGRRLHQAAQIVEQRRILGRQRLTSAARLSNAIGFHGRAAA